MKKYKVVSLFSGCGGMDLGFEGGFNFLNKRYPKNKLEVIWANDIDKPSCKTFFYNFKKQCSIGDIKNISSDKIPDADIIIGGFPCQDFSVAGKRRGMDTERGKLFFQMLRIVKDKKPKAFVAENVKGLTNIKNGDVLDLIKEEFRKIGYDVDHNLYKAYEYGVPQLRERVFIVGIRKDLKKTFKVPKKAKKIITAKEAIDDLWGKEHTDSIPNQNQYSKAKKSKGQGNNQIKKDRPGPTIRAEHHGNIEFHYKDWRRLTVRECARIQSFPDNFVFPESASASYKQIGNAVPPVLAWHIAKALLKTLSED